MLKVRGSLLKDAFRRYNRFDTVDDIRKAYNRPSSKKLQAWEYCKKLCVDFDGEALRIVGAGPYKFSAGFVFKDADGEKCFGWITASHDWYCPVKELEETK